MAECTCGSKKFYEYTVVQDYIDENGEFVVREDCSWDLGIFAAEVKKDRIICAECDRDYNKTEFFRRERK